jgi:hypothetical protein
MQVIRPFFEIHEGAFMVPAVMIRCITITDHQGASAERKLRILNISGEPGSDPRPAGPIEKILVAAVQNAASIDEAFP